MNRVLFVVAIIVCVVLSTWLAGMWVWEGTTLYVGPLSLEFGYGPGAWFPGRYL